MDAKPAGIRGQSRGMNRVTETSVYIVAEIGSVHDGSFGNALRLIEAAAACGVDAVKFQTHIAAAETLPDAPSPPYFSAEPRFAYFERTSFTVDKWKELKLHCDRHGIEFLSSPFSVEAVALLEEVGVAKYKIPSGEVTNLPLLEAAARTGKPVILSSGMSDWNELDRAVERILNFNPALTILQCTSEYPCAYENVGLNVMLEMKERYRLPVGLSDHTLTNYASFAAVTLGASVIERHFAFSRLMYGSDAKHSLEPAELRDLVDGIRAIERMIATEVDKTDLSRFRQMKRIFQKSVVSLEAIPKGTVIQDHMLGCRKPGTGIPPVRLPEIVGKRATIDIPVGRILTDSDFE